MTRGARASARTDCRRSAGRGDSRIGQRRRTLIVEESFDVTNWTVDVDTVAVFETEPAKLFGLVTMVIVVVLPTATVPSWHVTRRFDEEKEQLPCVVVDDRYVSFDASVSVATVEAAAAGPVLVTVRVKWSGWRRRS
jgi:hypothetical protein